VLEHIPHSNANHVSPICCNRWARVLIVDKHANTSSIAIRITRGVRD
jgi:hypothetical protein